MELLNNAMRWRYAAKRMNGNKVPEETVQRILDAAHLAPSGIGLQPYEILVTTDPELKRQILPIASNQAPVTESSHLLIFAAWDDYTPERINNVFNHLNAERQQESSVSDRQRQFALNYFSQFSAEENFHHAAKQAHIGLGIAVAAAALQAVDATPMEGFDAKRLDQFLNLKQKGLRSSMLLALGYRNAAADWNLKLKKVRKPFHEFVKIIAAQ